VPLDLAFYLTPPQPAKKLNYDFNRTAYTNFIAYLLQKNQQKFYSQIGFAQKLFILRNEPRA
jgi:hypothetical protein